jgi:hypothetical protein
MRAAFVLALIFSAVLLPLQQAAAVTVTADVQLLVGFAVLESRDVVVVEADNVTIHLPTSDKTIQGAVVNVNGVSTTCSTVVVSGCPTPSDATLSGCDDARTYFIVPGGAGVGVFDNGDTIDSTVLAGSITLTCSTFPPPTASKR